MTWFAKQGKAWKLTARLSRSSQWLFRTCRESLFGSTSSFGRCHKERHKTMPTHKHTILTPPRNNSGGHCKGLTQLIHSQCRQIPITWQQFGLIATIAITYKHSHAEQAELGGWLPWPHKTVTRHLLGNTTSNQGAWSIITYTRSTLVQSFPVSKLQRH